MSAPSSFFQEEIFTYPKPLIEISGLPMIHWVIDSLLKINGEKKFFFILNYQDCVKFHLDDTIKILTNDEAIILVLKNNTQGAVCSVLMSIDRLDMNQPLIIANGDQILENNFNEALSHFDYYGFDAGVVTFDSVHPRWSYIRKEGMKVVEATEKRPISRAAIAGIYYYRKAQYYADSAFKVLYKGNSQGGSFYISATINEMILNNLNVGYFQVNNSIYHSFYSPQKIQEFELNLSKR